MLRLCWNNTLSYVTKGEFKVVCLHSSKFELDACESSSVVKELKFNILLCEQHYPNFLSFLLIEDNPNFLSFSLKYSCFDVLCQNIIFLLFLQVVSKHCPSFQKKRSFAAWCISHNNSTSKCIATYLVFDVWKKKKHNERVVSANTSLVTYFKVISL